MKQSRNYVVVGSRPWSRRVFDDIITQRPGNWKFVSNRADLSLENLAKLNPDYVFFLHRSWKVPEKIIQNFECVGFHMTDLPYGRGGSPLQNLISRGHRHTKLSAIRMRQEMDAGEVYLKEDLCLEGGAEEIYIRASELSAKMIFTILDEGLVPEPQQGDPTTFRRRTPAESVVPSLNSLEQVHDFIRMLDAQDYPHAFLEHAGFRYEFSRSTLYDGRIVADVTITATHMETD